jgi:Sigma-70 factor, region 1.1
VLALRHGSERGRSRRDDGGHLFFGIEIGNVVMTDEASLWLQKLKTLGQSQGYLTHTQVNESLPLTIVHPEKIEEIVEQLKRAGIRIVPG